uniref:Uncharacterized protein n=1 Tax=Aegilops tauschii TaxID=37682 RepID=M8BE03_AEGTA
MAWHKQIRALLPTSDLKPSQHVLGGTGTESVRYGAHVITRPSAPKQLAGCCEGDGAPAMPGEPGNGGNAGMPGRGGGAGMKTSTSVIGEAGEEVAATASASASWPPARYGTDGALTACVLSSGRRIVAAASAAYVRSKTIDLVSAIASVLNLDQLRYGVSVLNLDQLRYGVSVLNLDQLRYGVSVLNLDQLRVV